MSTEGKKVIFKIKKPAGETPPPPVSEAPPPIQVGTQPSTSTPFVKPPASRVVLKGVKVHIGEIVLREKP